MYWNGTLVSRYAKQSASTSQAHLLQEVGNPSVEGTGSLEVRPLLGLVNRVRLAAVLDATSRHIRLHCIALCCVASSQRPASEVSSVPVRASTSASGIPDSKAIPDRREKAAAEAKVTEINRKKEGGGGGEALRWGGRGEETSAELVQQQPGSIVILGVRAGVANLLQPVRPFITLSTKHTISGG